MSTTESSLVSLWHEKLAAGGVGMTLVDAAHPLQIFVGLTDLGAARLVVRSISRPTMPTLSDLVLVERYEDASGKWSLSLTLQDPKFDEVFIRLADDVHSRSAQSPSEIAALGRVDDVFNEWRRLLRARPHGVLTMEELRGLVGEVWLLLNVLNKGRSLEAAIEGWLGPMGLPQDFWYPDTGYHEAKAIGPSTGWIKITSEAQLDASPLELMVLRLGNVHESVAGAFSLLTLATKVKSTLAQAGAPLDGFDMRMSRLGVDLGHSFYRDTWFALASVAWFGVTADFPAIRGSMIDASISRVTYRIAASDIDSFKTKEVQG